MRKTEKEALKQWCPFARTPIWITEETAIGGNRMTDASFGVNMHCIGSECMAWRWSKGWTSMEGEEVGYCGLAGKPAGEVE